MTEIDNLTSSMPSFRARHEHLVKNFFYLDFFFLAARAFSRFAALASRFAGLVDRPPFLPRVAANFLISSTSIRSSIWFISHLLSFDTYNILSALNIINYFFTKNRKKYRGSGRPPKCAISTPYKRVENILYFLTW